MGDWKEKLRDYSVQADLARMMRPAVIIWLGCVVFSFSSGVLVAQRDDDLQIEEEGSRDIAGRIQPKHFDSICWKRYGDQPFYARAHLWVLFKREYPLVGMSRWHLESLLGPPDSALTFPSLVELSSEQAKTQRDSEEKLVSARYFIRSARSGSFTTWVEFNYDADTQAVQCYRYGRNGRVGSWIVLNNDFARTPHSVRSAKSELSRQFSASNTDFLKVPLSSPFA